MTTILEEPVRSEKPSLDLLDDVFRELMAAPTPAEQAQLLVIITDLYADAGCRCEEKDAAYGPRSKESESCYVNVRKSREEMLRLFEQFCTKRSLA